LSLITALSPFGANIQGALGDLCPLSPLGNRPEDVQAWNKVYAEDQKPPKEDLSWEERRDRYNAKIVQEKTNKWQWVTNMALKYAETDCPVKTFNEVVDWGMKKTGLNYKSSRTKAELRAHVKEEFKNRGVDYNERRLSAKARPLFLLIANFVASHYEKHGNRKLEDVIAWVIEKKGYQFSEEEMAKLLCYVKYLLERISIDWEVLSGVKLQKSLPLCIRKKNKEISSKTAGRGKGKYAPNLVKAVFAILKGRVPWYPFGQKTSRNDPNWVTCKSLHYDNCKVLFSEKALFRPVYELLELGAKVKDIVCEYGILLHKHHGLAVDTEFSVWQPTGLAKELKANVCQKYLGL